MKKYISILIMIFVSNIYGANLTETNNVIFKGTVLCSNGLSTGSSILPTTSNSYDIGSSNMPFRHGYFGTNSLYLGQNKLGVSSNSSLTYNNNTVPTNISVNGNLGSVNDGVAYANVDIPNYDPVTDQIFVDQVSGREVTLDAATATLASGVTDTWNAISVSSNGLVVAAWTRSIATGKGYVYIGTNGPNSLVKNDTLGLQTTSGIKVTPDGSKIFVTHYADPWYNGSYVKRTTDNGSTWQDLNAPTATYVDASDDGSVIIVSAYYSTNSGSTWAGTPGSAGNWHHTACAVSGDGNVLMSSWQSDPTGPLRFYISTNRGVSFVNTVNGSGDPGQGGYGEALCAATYTGDRVYIATCGNADDGVGRIFYIEAPNYNVLNNISPKVNEHYRSVDCSPDGRGVIVLAESDGAYGNSTSHTGTVYVSTNYGATFSAPTNFYDVGTLTPYPRWLGKCTWQDNIHGGLAVRGGAGDGKIYRVEIGTVVTNTLNLLGDAAIYGSLSVDNSLTVNNEFYAGSHILPTASNQYDIGSSNMPFRHGYFGTNSLYIGDYKISKAQAESWDAGGTNGNNAYNFTNFPPNVVQTNDPKYVYVLTNESDTLSTVIIRGNNNAAGLSITNLGGLSSTGVVALASKSGMTNSPSRLTLSDQLFENLDGGTYIGRDNVTRKRELANVGQTWTAVESNRSWQSVSVSSDGKYQTAVVYGGKIHVSSDYGQTWAAKDSDRDWVSVSISSDGKYQTAVVYGGKIHVSSDYGQAWTAKDSNRIWYAVSLSSDGKYQTAVAYNGQIYVSADYGQTWTAKDSTRIWTSVSVSSDGKYQTAVVYDGQIYVSSDYGQTFTAKDSMHGWRRVSISSDGKYQTAVTHGGQIYVSSDYGQTWTAKDSGRDWRSVSLSSDGKYQTAVVAGGQIYVSSDYGQTWAAKDSDRVWYSVSISSDGKYQTAVVYNGQIYVSVADEVVRGNLVVTNGSITAGGGFYGSGSNLTDITAAQVGAVATNGATYYAAPACYQITLTNTSALSYTNTWSPTSKVSRVTLTSTGTCTFVWNWPSGQDASMRFALDMTGMPSVVFPAGAIYLSNGLYGSTAPSLGVSNYVNVIHDPVTYQVMAWTNALGTWGTP